MNKYIVTSDLRRVLGKADNLSYLKQAADLHPNWDIVESDVNRVVLKNNTGLLNYDPHIIFTYENGYFYMSPCKSYDSSKSWENQEGAISNSDNGESYRFSVSNKVFSFNPEITGILINDYKIHLLFYNYRNGGEHYNYGQFLSFEIFDAVDKNTSGMRCQSSNYHFYIYANSIWYSHTWDSVWNRIGNLNIDKPLNIYQKPSPNGTIIAYNKTYYINTTDNKDDPPVWQFVGQTKTFYTQQWYYYIPHKVKLEYEVYYNTHIFAPEGHFAQVTTPEGVKECLISGLDGQIMELDKVERPTIWKQ